MSEVYLRDTILTNIGDAIRTKLNNTTTYLPSEMADAVNSIGAKAAVMSMRKAVSRARIVEPEPRTWKDWESATWDDIKFAADGLLDYPDGDIAIGKMKIADGLVFELVDMVDGVLVFKSASPQSVEPNPLALDDYWMGSEVFNQVTDDKFFLPLDEYDKELDGYHLMFAIGPIGLGSEYTGKVYPDPEEINIIKEE